MAFLYSGKVQLRSTGVNQLRTTANHDSEKIRGYQMMKEPSD
jgi:hypothetical protein